MASLYDTIAAALVVFSEVLANPKELTPQLVRAWEVTLTAAGVKPEQVEPAVARLLASQTFFPTPADFLKVVNPAEDQDASAELAWQKVLDCIRRIGRYGTLTAADLGGDSAALWAVDRMDWQRLCSEDPDHRSIRRAEFVRLYRAAKQGNAAVERVPGLHERTNDIAGLPYDRPELIGRPELPDVPQQAPSQRQLAAPACPECGGRSRHLLWCSALDHLDKPKALPAGETEGFATVGAAMTAAAAAEASDVTD